MKIGSYDYHGLCKAFINQTKTSGKTAGGRLSFNELSIYSYDTLLGTLDPDNKVLLVYKTTANYSRTSQKHASTLERVAGSLVVFSVIESSAVEQLEEYHKNILHNILLFKRARTIKHFYKEVIIRKYNEMKQYSKYLNLDKRTKEYKHYVYLKDSIFVTMFKNKIL